MATCLLKRSTHVMAAEALKRKKKKAVDFATVDFSSWSNSKRGRKRILYNSVMAEHGRVQNDEIKNTYHDDNRPQASTPTANRWWIRYHKAEGRANPNCHNRF